MNRYLAFISFLSFASVASANSNVWVVEPAGNGHFLDIQSAVDASSDGDVIFVRPHLGMSNWNYQPFSIDAKALSVVGIDLPGHTFGIRPSITIQNLDRSQQVVLANLRVAASGLSPNPGLKLTDCDGTVRVNRCELLISGNGVAEALWVEHCVDVALVDSVLHGGYAPAQAGFLSNASQVALYRCDVEGGYAARPAYESGNSLLFSQGGRFKGGEGEWVDCGEIPGQGGAGTHLWGSASLYTLDSELLGGPGGHADGYFCSDPTQGPSGPPISIEGNATHTNWYLEPRSIDAPDLVFGGATVPLVVRGQPGDRVFLLEGEPGFSLARELGGVALLEPLQARGIVLGTVPTSGILEAVVQVDSPPPATPTIARFFQIMIEDSAGQRQLGEPWSAVVASKAWNGSCGLPVLVDCNGNGTPDLCDISSGNSQDANNNLIPDECELQSVRVYVDLNATGANNGSSWADAFVSLRSAIEQAKTQNYLHTEIWVARGTYRPAPPNGSRNYSFEINNRIDWYGGFSGVEQNLDERDPILNVTTLSGDLNGDDGPDFSQYEDNSYIVVRSNYYGVDEPAIIEGFTIRGGSGHNLEAGAGVQAAGCYGLVLRNCRIVANKAEQGAGAYLVGPRVEDCVFSANRAYDEGGGAFVYLKATVLRCTFADNQSTNSRGGGLYIDSDTDFVIEDGVFERNTAPATWSAVGGGAIAAKNSNVTIKGCLFVDNHAGNVGGAIRSESYGSLQVESCTFLGNVAKDGGAIWVRRTATITNSVFSGNAALRGGAIFAETMGAHELRAQLCTFSANSAQQFGGGIYLSPERPFATTNSIYWGNQDAQGAGMSAQIYGMESDAASYCCIQGFIAARLPRTIQRNLNVDPRFFDPYGPDGISGTLDDDLRLTPFSPCLDAGNNGAVPLGVEFDLDGLPRFVDMQNVPDTGKGIAPFVDMGCYERQ